ncbi:MAG: hypothetical protein JNL89_11990 [Rhodanobacteraceae bacterium]|nr:hypothetical protein [Rhodanobacteraceae bacterium]
MNPIRTAIALLLAAPAPLLAHPDHAPGEPEHWVYAALVALGLAVATAWQRNRAARVRKPGPGEHR